MEQKELKRMTRSELIEVIYELELQNQELKEELDAAKESLKDRTIMIDEAGSIAEAALKINHVFESVQNAVDDYVNNMKLLTINRCEKMMLEQINLQKRVREKEAKHEIGRKTERDDSKDGGSKGREGTPEQPPSLL